MNNKKRVPLNYEERKIIESLRIDKKGFREIGRILNRDHTVVQREINRNSEKYLPYSADKAQFLADKRLLNKKEKIIRKELGIEKLCCKKIKKE